MPDEHKKHTGEGLQLLEGCVPLGIQGVMGWQGTGVGVLRDIVLSCNLRGEGRSAGWRGKGGGRGLLVG